VWLAAKGASGIERELAASDVTAVAKTVGSITVFVDY
jgi:hypothetical protein